MNTTLARIKQSPFPVPPPTVLPQGRPSSFGPACCIAAASLSLLSAPAIQGSESPQTMPRDVATAFSDLSASSQNIAHLPTPLPPPYETPLSSWSATHQALDVEILARHLQGALTSNVRTEKQKSPLGEISASMFGFVKSHMFALASLGGLAFLAYKRCFINRLTINTVRLLDTEDAQKNKTDCIRVATLSEEHPFSIFGLDPIAFFGFHGALLQAVRNHPELPILQFPARGGYDRILKHLRKVFSAKVLAYDLVKNKHASLNSIPIEHEWARTNFLTYTFEPEETTEPRGLFISAPELLSVLAHYPRWWKAAEHGATMDQEANKRKVLSLIEASLNIFYRGEGIFEKLCPGIRTHAKVEELFQNAKKQIPHLLPLFAKDTKESLQYLDRLVQEGPDAAEKITEALEAAIFRKMYGKHRTSPKDVLTAENRYHAGDGYAYKGLPGGPPKPSFIPVYGNPEVVFQG
jgi:hypothetical protein